MKAILALAVLVWLAGCVGTPPRVPPSAFGPRPTDFQAIRDHYEASRAMYPAQRLEIGTPWRAAYQAPLGEWSYGWAVAVVHHTGRYVSRTDVNGNVVTEPDVFGRQWFRPAGSEWRIPTWYLVEYEGG